MRKQYVWIVNADTRENHPPVVSVRKRFADALEDAKAYMLKHNRYSYAGSVDEMVQGDKALSAKDFCAKYLNSGWIVSASIERRQVR